MHEVGLPISAFHAGAGFKSPSAPSHTLYGARSIFTLVRAAAESCGLSATRCCGQIPVPYLNELTVPLVPPRTWLLTPAPALVPRDPPAPRRFLPQVVVVLVVRWSARASAGVRSTSKLLPRIDGVAAVKVVLSACTPAKGGSHLSS